MINTVKNVLFLCTGNSARSILAEALLTYRGLGNFIGYSAGSMPRGSVHPLAIRLLRENRFNTDYYRSKSWEEFAGDNAPEMDFVITVCDRAAGEVCPLWPGQPVAAHWGIEDPDRPDLSEKEQWRLFEKAYHELDHRIRLFVSLPLEKLDRLSLKKKLDDIGRSCPDVSLIE